MTTKATNTSRKDAALFALLIIGGVAVFFGEVHKIILRAVWPYLVTFYANFIGVYGP
jgi:hypothetical protein